MSKIRASKDLENAVDDLLSVSWSKGISFPRLRQMLTVENGIRRTIPVMIKLVSNAGIPTGLMQLKAKGLLDISLEQIVINFENEFPNEVVEITKWKLKELNEGKTFN